MSDPFESEEYQKFVEGMIPLCHCEYDQPCDGVLAGGLCERKRSSFDTGDRFEEDDD